MKALRLAAAWSLCLLACLAQASTGLLELPGIEGDGPVTLFYPSSSAGQPVQRGRYALQAAEGGTPARGNGRLVVVSHGSGGSPWTQADLAERFVKAGFVVAMPEHRGDNWRDRSDIGPTSWKRRPEEVSRAIDAVLADPRFAPLVDARHVGMYGMSAGGHTALSLAGGRWSPSILRDHCQAHLDDDFATCVGMASELTGGPMDGVKKALSRLVIAYKLSDPAFYAHTDPRITAILADVPFAADFDMASLARPAVPLGLLRAGSDPWLVPRYHVDRVIAACQSCELVLDLPGAGHGSLLDLAPLRLQGLAERLLGDPPGFDRALVGPARQRIVTFFEQHLELPATPATR
jgi:predicted dienelactone hydrolase